MAAETTATKKNERASNATLTPEPSATHPPCAVEIQLCQSKRQLTVVVCTSRFHSCSTSTPERQAAQQRRRPERGKNPVLRFNLHALYDFQLLTIDANGVIHVDPTIEPHYNEFHGGSVIQ